MNEPARKPPVDVEAFRAMMREAGIEEIAESTLEMYRDEAAPIFEALAEAVAAGEITDIETRAHALKSSSLSIRADRFAELLGRLEQLAENGDVAGAQVLLPEVAVEYRSVMDYLA